MRIGPTGAAVAANLRSGVLSSFIQTPSFLHIRTLEWPNRWRLLILITFFLCLASFLPAIFLPQRPLLLWLTLVAVSVLRMLGLRVEGPGFFGILLATSSILVLLAALLGMRRLMNHYGLCQSVRSALSHGTWRRDYLLFGVLLIPALLCPMAACFYLPGIGPLLLLSLPDEPQFPIWFVQEVLKFSLPAILMLALPALWLRTLRDHALAWLLAVLLLTNLLAAEHVKRSEIMAHVPDSSRASLITQSFLADLSEYGHEIGKNAHASYMLNGVEYIWSYRQRQFVGNHPQP